MVMCACVMGGCTKAEFSPISINFSNITGAKSSYHTISIKFLDEKVYDQNFVDVILTCGKSATLTMYKEYSSIEDKKVIKFNDENKEVSLASLNLLNYEKQENNKINYKDAVNTNIIITSDTDVTITLKSVVYEKDMKVKTQGKEFEVKLNSI